MRLVDDTPTCDVLARLGIGFDSPSAARPDHRLAGREILIVEDDAQREFALGQPLQAAGAWVAFVGAPRKAGFQAGIAAQAGQGYHLLVVNLDLPDIRTGGEAVLRRHGYEGPILGVSRLKRPLRQAAALAAGCAAHLGADCTAERLVDTVAGLTPACQSPPVSFDIEETEALGSSFAAYPHLTGMLRQFLNRLPAQVDQLEAAAREQNLDALRELTEQLKRMSTSHGFDGIARRASQLHHHVALREQVDELASEARELAALCRRATARPMSGATLLPPPA